MTLDPQRSTNFQLTPKVKQLHSSTSIFMNDAGENISAAPEYNQSSPSSHEAVCIEEPENDTNRSNANIPGGYNSNNSSTESQSEEKDDVLKKSQAPPVYSDISSDMNCEEEQSVVNLANHEPDREKAKSKWSKENQKKLK